MSKKKRVKKKIINKIFLFFLLIFLTYFSLYAYGIFKEKQKLWEKEKIEKEVLAKKNLANCSINDYLSKEEKRKIAKKIEYERLAEIALKKRQEEAEKSPNKVLIVSTSARGKKSFGYFYAFGDGFMFRKGRISSGRKNYETPTGFFNLQYKKKENMSNLYPDESGRNNMNNMLAITKNGIALHEGSPYVASHGCVHIPKKYSNWLYNWVDYKTKIYITNKSKIDYKHKTLSQILSEIEKFKKVEDKKNSIKKEKIVKWPNGNIKEKWTWKGGRLEGKQYFYYQNGNLKEVKNYYHNRKNGVQKTYYPNGQLKSIVYLAGGKVWEKSVWSSNGEMIDYYQRELPNKK